MAHRDYRGYIGIIEVILGLYTNPLNPKTGGLTTVQSMHLIVTVGYASVKILWLPYTYAYMGVVLKVHVKKGTIGNTLP